MVKQLLKRQISKSILTILLVVNVSLFSVVFAATNLFDQDPALKASISGTTVSLSWSVDQYANVEAIIIERSFNGGEFSEVHRFEEIEKETFKDYLLKRDLENGNLAYRVRIIDEEGKVSFTDVAQVDLEKTKSLKPEIITNGGKAEVIFHSAQDGKTNIMLFNNAGRVVKQTSIYPEFGSNREYIDVSNLHPGLYLLRIEQDGTVTTTKFFLR